MADRRVAEISSVLGSAPLLSLSILLTSSLCFFSSCVVKSLHFVSPPVLMTCEAEHPPISRAAIAASAIRFIIGLLHWGSSRYLVHRSVGFQTPNRVALRRKMVQPTTGRFRPSDIYPAFFHKVLTRSRKRVIVAKWPRRRTTPKSCEWPIFV